MTALCLRLSDENGRIAVELSIGTTLTFVNPICATYAEKKLKQVGSTDWSAEEAETSAETTAARCSLLNVIIRTALSRKISAQREPNYGRSWKDGKRPNGVTIMPWTRGRFLAWDVTLPDTYATSPHAQASIRNGEAADQAVVSNRVKLSPMFLSWSPGRAAECRAVKDYSSYRCWVVTLDPLETSYLVAVQRGTISVSPKHYHPIIIAAEMALQIILTIT